MKTKPSKPTNKRKVIAVGGGDFVSRKNAYDRYKKTTRAFLVSLAKMTPPSMPLVSVTDIARASNFVMETSTKKPIEFDNDLLENLNATIRLREKVGATYADERDDGHKYMIQVLLYCRTVLRLSQHGQGNEKTVDGENSNSLYRVFDPNDNDSDNYEDNDSEMAKDVATAFAAIQAPTKEYRIEEDLFKGSLAFQANMFFLAADNLFGIVIEAYETLQTTIKALKESTNCHQEYNHQAVIAILQASISINLALENVKYLENSFLESTDLITIYNALAVIIFQEEISSMEEIVGSRILEKNPQLCSTYAGHCIRFGFLGNNYYLRKGFEKITREYFFEKCKTKPKLTAGQVEKLKEVGMRICGSADMETMW